MGRFEQLQTGVGRGRNAKNIRFPLSLARDRLTGFLQSSDNEAFETFL